MRASTVTIKTEQDIEKLRISGRLAAQVLEDWCLYKARCFN